MPARLPVRLAWVSAELAMARGDGAAAVGHAERAVELAGGARLGAAHREIATSSWPRRCAAPATSRRPAASPTPRWTTTDDWESIPLRWALACLLADIGSATRSAAEVRGHPRRVLPIQCVAGAACGRSADTGHAYLDQLLFS